MSPTGKIVLAGCGNMGFAMLRGWLASGVVEAESVYVVEPVEELATRAAQLGVHTCAATADLPLWLEPALVFLAVKPQVIADILPDYRRFAEKATFVSIVAGIRTNRLEDLLGQVAIIRAMPNTPAAIGKGSTVLFCNARVETSVIDSVTRLLESGGAVHRITDESLMDAVTAISGSGPAYVFLFIEGLASAGEKLGLPAALAMSLAKETVAGAAALATQSSAPEPEELRRQVTSPGGTTQAALERLLDHACLETLLFNAASAAHDRSRALG